MAEPSSVPTTRKNSATFHKSSQHLSALFQWGSTVGHYIQVWVQVSEGLSAWVCGWGHWHTEAHQWSTLLVRLVGPQFSITIIWRAWESTDFRIPCPESFWFSWFPQWPNNLHIKYSLGNADPADLGTTPSKPMTQVLARQQKNALLKKQESPTGSIRMQLSLQSTH